MAEKEETPKYRKKTVTWTNEMIEDLIDFIEIHPIVAFEAIYEPMLTSFWSLISFAVQLFIIMQYKWKHPPLLQKMSFSYLKK
jgi:TRAP-type mannitol/chloroaromatic compound transport system permease large subunit